MRLLILSSELTTGGTGRLVKSEGIADVKHPSVGEKSRIIRWFHQVDLLGFTVKFAGFSFNWLAACEISQVECGTKYFRLSIT